MRFIDCWWLSFSTIIDGMIFLFFEQNYFKKFQNTFIGILKKILTFKTFMLKKNELRDKKKTKIEIFTSKSPSTGLNVKPFFTVSAVSSS
jgi:hypothetical protein